MFKMMYVAGLLLMFGTRIRYRWQARNNAIAVSQKTWLEAVVLVAAFVGMVCIPLLFVFTTLLDFASYALPSWAGWIAMGVFLASLWLLWRSHVDLGRNWSETLELRRCHTLVTTGVYRYVRHPMYAAFLLWGLAQPLLLQNSIAGWSHLVAFLVLFFLRVPHEERMMRKQFGDAYQTYMERTGSVLPRVF